MEQTNEVIVARGDKVLEEEEKSIINPVKKVKKTKTKTAPEPVAEPVAEPVPKTLEQMREEREALDEAIRQAEMINNLKTKADTYKQTIINTLNKKAEDKKRKVEELQAQITLLMDEGAQLVQEIDTLTETTGDELTLLITEKYKEYVAEPKETKTPSKEKKDKTTEKKAPVKRDRVSDFKSIPVGKELYIKYYMDTAVFIKTDGGLIQRRWGETYASLNAAATAFYKDVGLNRNVNVWETFKTDYDGKRITIDTYVRLLRINDDN